MSHIVFGLFVALVIVCVARGLGMYMLASFRDRVTRWQGDKVTG
jgi:hypothetical protein